MPSRDKLPAARGKATTSRSRAAMDGAGLLRAAREGAPPPIVVMTGADLFSRERDLAALRAACLPEGLADFNSVVLFGDDVKGAAVAQHAAMLPFAAPRRLVIVRRAGALSAREVEPIGAYAETPSETTCLILICDEGKAPILTALGRSTVFTDYPAPRDYQLSRWIQQQADSMQMALDEEAARLIAELAGGRFIQAMAALECAALSARVGSPGSKGKPRVTARLVADLITGGRDENPFHLNDALMSREGARAITLLRDRIGAGDTGYALLARLESQLRRQMEMRAEVEAGTPARSVVQARSPMLPPSVKSRLAGQLESFDTGNLIDALRLARLADRAVKGRGSGNEAAHLEALIWRVVSL